jgi:hypothetical protein
MKYNRNKKKVKNHWSLLHVEDIVTVILKHLLKIRDYTGSTYRKWLLAVVPMASYY